MLRVALSLVLGAAPLAVAYWLWRRVSHKRPVPARFAGYMVAGGAVTGALAVYVERLVLAWTELSFEASRVGEASALLAMFLLAAPLEEGLKVLVVWPLYRARRLVSPRLGVTYAACAAAGFAAVEAVIMTVVEPIDGVLIARVAVAIPAHLFFAGAWGYALGSGKRTRGRWFSVSWLVAMLLHGLYDHIVFGRGPGLLVVVAPMFLFMALGAWVALREVAPTEGSSLPPSLRPAILSQIPDPPSLRAMRRAMRRTERPLMLHWIAIGALVTLGVMIVSTAVAVFVGHRIGIDFAMADESDVRSSGPLVLIGAAQLTAFPLAGYLVARASAAHSVLEPAMGAGVAITLVVALLSVTAPIAVVFALVVAPVAFGLACGGAWFGMER